MTSTFKQAILISTLLHTMVLAPIYSLIMPRRQIEERKPMVVDYVVIKEVAKIVETKTDFKTKTPETPRVELAREVVTRLAPSPGEAKKIEEPKDISRQTAKRESQIKSTRDYINYYQLIREKIRRALKNNYKDYSNEGEVYFVFTLNSEGGLVKYEIDSAKSTNDRTLRDIAILSLQEAAPFQAFPKGLSVPAMSFNLAVSFKKR